ncbi:hypothetical protein NEO15_08290, partial [Escherichia coli]|nr:hypothetical protein [Escherichia coli]
AISKLELVLDIYPSLSLILRYIYCLVFQGASSQKNKYTPLLDILESVINDDDCDSVGGAMQYISCNKDRLKLCCHMLFEENNHKYMKAGVDLNELNEKFIPSGLFFETDAIIKR